MESRPDVVIPPETPWHALGVPEVAARLRVDLLRGLDPDEAVRRAAVHGPNRLPERRGPSRARRFAGQFASLLVAILVGAAALSAALGELADAVAIAGIVLVNAVVGYLQESRAADALAALRRMAAPTARVRRGGEPLVVPADELVPGDVVVLEAGDRVPADLRITRSTELLAVEAALTGESAPSRKSDGPPADAAAPLAERRTMAYAGTVAVAGMAEAVVVATGTGTEFGRIAELVRSVPEEETPLQVRLRTFGRWLVAGSGAVVALVFVLGVLRDVPAIEMLFTAIGLAVAAIPEGLPAVVTISLALGVQRMARRRTLVRRLASVETLGCTTVICTDKTGTLTEGRMTVAELRGADGPAILRAGISASTARLVEREGRTEVAGDPTEGALLEAGRKIGLEAEALDAEWPVVSIRPFDPERKRMSIVRRTPSGLRSFVKGAPESVLPLCGSARDETGELAGRGLRVLAVATKELREGEDPEAGLEFLGLVGMHDPPRAGAAEAVRACREAGIRTVMITGDNPATALAVARDLGIARGEAEVLTGPQVEALGEEELEARVESVSIYARVSPGHKLRIVKAWRARGAVVAMTGDGVNDAPALRGADLGIAMGRTGTDVAKDASAMVITDDDFATIVAAVEEGRSIYENIRKSLLYLLSGNLAEIAVMAAAVVAGLPLPLLPIQLLWINLVTDGLPALALAVDPAEPGLLKRPPRRPGAEIADREFLGWMFAGGALVAACTLGVFLYVLESGAGVDKARTYAFSVLVGSEVLKAFGYRSRTRTLWELGAWSNARLAGVAIATIGLQILTHHVGFLGGFLKTGRLSWPECAAVLAVAFVPVSVLEFWKLLRRGRGS